MPSTIEPTKRLQRLFDLILFDVIDFIVSKFFSVVTCLVVVLDYTLHILTRWMYYEVCILDKSSPFRYGVLTLPLVVMYSAFSDLLLMLRLSNTRQRTKN